jgi:hypothetical protein
VASNNFEWTCLSNGKRETNNSEDWGKVVAVDRAHSEERFPSDRETSSQLEPPGRLKSTWRKTVEEETSKMGRPGKKLEPWRETGSAGSPMLLKEWKEISQVNRKGLSFNRGTIPKCGHRDRCVRPQRASGKILQAALPDYKSRNCPLEQPAWYKPEWRKSWWKSFVHVAKGF